MVRKVNLSDDRIPEKAARFRGPVWGTVLLALFTVLTSASVPAESVEVGDAPPNYIGKTSDGREINLEDSAGRIRIVSFWATWCAPCLKELPVLSAIQKSAGLDRMYVIAVNLKESKRQYLKSIRAMEDYGLEFVHDRRGQAARSYDVEGIPHMLIVDVDGTVAFRYIGYGEESLEKIVGDINSLLIKNYAETDD